MLPYLERLGISHIYLSPILQAAQGSSHGYDVIDHQRISAELGGEEAYLALSRSIIARGMKQIVDIVPNHMSIADPRNRWWWDVLEQGPASCHAEKFDIDWHPPEAKNRNIVLVPVLDDRRGHVIERGDIVVERCGAELRCRYLHHVLPVSPQSLGSIVRRARDRFALMRISEGSSSHARTQDLHLLGYLADALESLPRDTTPHVADHGTCHRDREVLKRILERLVEERPAVAVCMDETLRALNTSPDELDAFLCAQNHRLASWRTAEREIDYRRFFDVNTLVGLRTEDAAVFSATHHLVARLVRDGVVHGLRVDHVDGLVDPQGYLVRLRELAPQAWIVVEKVLSHGEELRADWPVEGTTGYEFCRDVLGLFLDPRAEGPLTLLYGAFTGRHDPFEVVTRAKRLHMIDDILSSEVERVVQALMRVCAQSRAHRDETRHDLRAAVRALAAAYPVYRSYVRPAMSPEGWQVHPSDVETVARAADQVRATHPGLEPYALQLLTDVLTGRVVTEGAADVVRRFQQLTGPTMAKGVEDCAFYDDARFIARNEVGADLNAFAVSPSEFHARNAVAQKQSPLRMVTTSTHDTKRSEDVRARLAVITEDVQWWGACVHRLHALGAQHRRGGLPEPSFELFIYQTLVGVWPIPWSRLRPYLVKAMREARSCTSWTRTNVAAEEDVLSFMAGCLADPMFVAELDSVVEHLRVPGYRCALAQLLVKLTCPGVPDVYQGTELWSFDLVDPDNRRAVDWNARARRLTDLHALTLEEIMAAMDQGVPKLALLHRALAVRRQWPEAFGPQGDYVPMDVQGAARTHVVAYTRGGRVMTVVPRLAFLRPMATLDAEVVFPQGTWTDVMTGDAYSGGPVRASLLFQRFPVSLLVRQAP